MSTKNGIGATYEDAWLIDGVRTPFADYNGALGQVSPIDLGIKAAREAFKKTGADPAVPCHFDMTTGTFNAQALTDVVNKIRGQALGCVYQVPNVEGGTVDPGLVNVDVNLDGKAGQIPKRPDNSTDACTTDGCWDYTDSSKTQIELLGKACNDVKNASSAKVQIEVGCQTLLK